MELSPVDRDACAEMVSIARNSFVGRVARYTSHMGEDWAKRQIAEFDLHASDLYSRASLAYFAFEAGVALRRRTDLENAVRHAMAFEAESLSAQLTEADALYRALFLLQGMLAAVKEEAA